MSLPTFRVPRRRAPLPWRWPVAALLLGAAVAAIDAGVPGLAPAGAWALGIFAAAIIGWTVLDLDETPVALAAALTLMAVGATTLEGFYAGMGDEFIWLLIGAFVMAAVLQASGLAERWALRLVASSRTPRALLRRLTLCIIVTAFVVPSTSGRAALLLPVFVALAQALPDARQVRALALLFPSVILLSACVSMLGAGAHLVALDFMQRLEGPVPGFMEWIWLAGPFGVLSSLLACELILRLFLHREERTRALALPQPARAPLTRQQKGVAAVTLAALLAWATAGWHGVPAPVVAVCGALAATLKPLTGMDMKAAFRQVEWNLVVFMAATLVMGEALLVSGAAQAVAAAFMNSLALDRIPRLAELAIAGLLALLSHLVVTSRTARATVLIPTVALPLAAAGIDASLLVFVMVIGSGFCQTLTISAKPVALFAGGDTPHYGGRDLAALSAALLPGLWLLLWLFAAWVWPWQGLG